MRITCFLLLTVVQALWVKSLENDPHGVQVQELNLDVDYRDFNETVDLVTEANRKAPSQVENHNGTIGHGATNGSDVSMTTSVDHDIFPLNLTYELRQDCGGPDCSGQSNRWLNMDQYSRFLLILSMTAMTLACLIILTALKLKLTVTRNWGYSPALMEDRGHELRVYRANTSTNHTTIFF